MMKKEIILMIILVCSVIVSAGYPNGMVAYWKLDQATGPVVDSYDGNPGTNNGSTRNVTGQVDKAFDFDNSAKDHVSVPYSTSFNLTNNFTLEAWINLDNYHSAPIISANTYYTLQILSNGKPQVYYYDTVNNRKATGSTTLQTGKWHHVAGTYDGSTLRIYLDGNEDGSLTISSSIASNTAPLSIGRESTSPQSTYFNGKIDEAAVYNRSLNASEVMQHFLAGNNSGQGYGEAEEETIPEVNGNLTQIFIILIVLLLLGALILHKK